MSADACWDLLMHLPPDSALMSALAADPEFAGDAEPGPPQMTEFGPQVQALAGIYDLLAALLSTVAGLGGGTPPKIPPYPRPQLPGSGRQRQRARDEFFALDAILTGGG